ncbi:Major Facilitator Superfamily protein [Roseovarius litorisediminis]|uniref:Major Facilitator Superfamily protein n=1 Tax=Roseovarius litorisediminis TaxID=1312363 RepID=A0A1Y5THN4_9RHOB|nr:MFS transporter [Roseovarius litorisediminis]SLN64059.1 Major Facilitator Superfamily protein [Roseovarius litorisediminis]
MHQRRIPEWLRHAPAPSVRGFAVLAGTEAIARGILISVFPLEMYNVLQDASLVSEAYFAVGLLSLIAGLMVPFLGRFVPRRWIYSAGALMFAFGALLALEGSAAATVTALIMITVATVTTFVCFNAYVLDYIAKTQLGQCETSRMFYSALGWTVGPALGVFLLGVWRPLPFLIAAVAAGIMLAVFLYMRLGNGRLITKAHLAPTNPLSYMPRFFAQPRLVAGWLFAVIRSCGWWIYIVYLPIFAVEQGLGDQLGGTALSISNGMLFLTPFMLRWMQRTSIRYAVRVGFLVSGALFLGGSLMVDLPWITVLCLVMASFFLILLDVSAGLPFLLAVKPSERTEMSAIYASYRDVSGIVTPGAAWMVLLVAPLAGVFALGGAGLWAAYTLARVLHPRLGKDRGQLAPVSHEFDNAAPLETA